MKRNLVKVVWLLSSILLSACSMSTTEDTYSNQEQYKNCEFKRTGEWWNNNFASLPTDVPITEATGEPEFCDFYEFSLDYYLFMISENLNGKNANFLNQKLFPLLETAGTNSCDDDHPSNAFNVRHVKSSTDDSPFILPENIEQAGVFEAIYDQNGNVVFYEVRFTRNLCDYETILSKPNFPGRTVELKMAWKVLEKGDSKDNFYRINAQIKNGADVTKTMELGLVGMHLAIGADNHPEMVWVTIEQNNNTIACDAIGAEQTAQSFISQSCATNVSDCQDLNNTMTNTELSLPAGKKPNDICEVYPFGTAANTDIDTRDGLNIALLRKLNKKWQGIFGQKKPAFPERLAVWKNYEIKGALWVSNPKESSTDDNQRGSLELANTVMETSFQGEFNGSGTGLNCFGCHGYTGSDNFKTDDNSKWNTTVSSKGPGLSHIFQEIIQGQNQSSQK